MQVTKNKQSIEMIEKIIKNALGEKEIVSIKELSEGMLNVAYNVSYADGTGSVVKIASRNGQGLMSNEVALMDAEVKAMRIMQNYDFVKVAQIQYYDESLEQCEGAYFIMERLEGENYFFTEATFTEQERAIISREIGVIQRRMKEIKNPQFGMLGDERRFDSLYDFFYMLVQNLFLDSEKRNIELGIEREEVLQVLEQDKAIFEEVTVPTLIHWDMWEGNIFVRDKHVCGIIDWERAMWGESFMDDRFRRYNRNRDFLEGYGQIEFTGTEIRRMNWYDLYLFGMMIAEVTYRQYEDDSQSKRMKPLILDAWNDLR